MVGKIILSIMQSLDGYIADKNYHSDFLEGYGGSQLSDVSTLEEGFDFAKINDVEMIVIGHKTFEQGYHEAYPEQTIYVISRENQRNDGRIHFVTPTRIVKLMLAKKRQGKNILLIGGGLAVRPFIRANAIDQYVIGTVPYIQGSGRRLFYPQDQPLPLQLESVDVMGGLTLSVYSPR